MHTDVISILLGVPAFFLLFLSDANDAFRKKNSLKWLFPFGAILLAIAIGIAVFFGEGNRPETAVVIVFGLISALLLVLEIHSLFFAIPTESSYLNPGKSRQVCTSGEYALCRHPGVLFFALLMVSLVIGSKMTACPAIVFTFLNIILAVFEDKTVFPLIIEGYDDYVSSVPFLIPNTKSIKEALKRRK